MNIRSSGWIWTPWIEVGGTGNVGTTTLPVQQTLLGLGATSSVAHALVTPQGTLDTGAGVTLQGSGPWTAKIAYQGQFGGNTRFTTLELLADFRW